jgi:dolichol-phosphate mannosyltransferase
MRGAAVSRRNLSVSVIVPTRNERDNVLVLVQRVAAVTHALDAEVLFVDDSDDDTPQLVSELMTSAPMPVRMVHRPTGTREGGLGGAVKLGLMATDADWAVVMDGDLQHPPEVILNLLEAGVARDLDIVVASRYSGAEGSAGGLSSAARKLVSSGATWAAKALFPRRLSQVTDPMSGFFAVRRSALDPSALRPDGFKVLLEILIRTRSPRIGEVPFVFAERNGGASKASGREGLRYIRQLIRLRYGSELSFPSPMGLPGLSDQMIVTLATPGGTTHSKA